MNQQTLAVMVCMSQTSVLRGHSPFAGPSSLLLEFPVQGPGTLTPSHPPPGSDFLPVAKLTSLPSLSENHVLGAQ